MSNTRGFEIDFAPATFGVQPKPKGRWSNKTIAWLITATLGVVAAVGFVADLSASTSLLGDAYNGGISLVSRLTESSSDKAIDQLVSEAKTKMPWVHDPTIYAPSVEYLRSHFEEMDPYNQHAVDLRFAQQQVDFGRLFSMIPAAAGSPITVRGRFRAAGLIETGEHAMSWAVELTDPRVPNAMLEVRVPTPTDLSLGFEYGQLVDAQGLVLADGVVKDPLGKHRAERVIYFAARSVIATELKNEINRGE